MQNHEELVEVAKAFFNYSDEEIQMVMANPKYRAMMEKAPQLMTTELTFRVEEAHGCACQHQTGQRIVFGADGSLNCGQSPEKICVYLLSAMMPIVYGAQEFILAGLDPNDLTFTKVGCFDTGPKCGGFGHVTVQLSAD